MRSAFNSMVQYTPLATTTITTLAFWGVFSFVLSESKTPLESINALGLGAVAAATTYLSYRRVKGALTAPAQKECEAPSP